MSELLRTLAAVFRRKGADAMPTAEVKHALSLDLRWFAPADAKRLVQHAVDVGLVEEADGVLRARFDVAKVDVPVTFRPTLAALDDVPDSVPPPPVRPTIAEPATAPAAAAPAAAHAPAPAPAAAPAPGPAEAALREAAHLAGEDVEALRKRAADEREKRGGLLSWDAAALVVARRFGVDVRGHAKRLREAPAAAPPSV